MSNNGRELASAHLELCVDEIEQLRVWYGHGEMIPRSELPHSASYINKLLQGEEFVSTVVLPRPTLVALHKAVKDFQGQRTPTERAVRYINGLFSQADAESTGRPAVVGRLGGSAVQMCIQTVPTFYDTLRQIETGIYRDQPCVSVFYRDNDGQPEPVLLQKTNQVTSALTLQPIELDGLKIPAGTVVSLLDEELNGYDLVGEIEMHDGSTSFQYAAYRMPSQVELNYGGLSPWAFPDHQMRVGYAVTDLYAGVTDANRMDMVTSTELGDFQTAACHILSACGVDNVVARTA